MTRKYAEIFCQKNVSSFCYAKATHIFSAKNIRILYIESAKTFNEMTLNELVKLTTLWTTGPWYCKWTIKVPIRLGRYTWWPWLHSWYVTLAFTVGMWDKDSLLPFCHTWFCHLLKLTITMQIKIVADDGPILSLLFLQETGLMWIVCFSTIHMKYQTFSLKDDKNILFKILSLLQLWLAL